MLRSIESSTAKNQETHVAQAHVVNIHVLVVKKHDRTLESLLTQQSNSLLLNRPTLRRKKLS